MVSRCGRIGFAGAFIGVVMASGCGAAGTGAQAGAGSGDAGQSATTPSLPVAEAGAPICGDSACAASETCETCSLDCGQCPACPSAPSCSEAVGIPVSPLPRLDLDIGESVDAGPEGSAPSELPGSDGCQNAQLSLRISQITTYSGGGQIYCIVSSSDGVSSEAALTGKTKDLGSGESYSFDPTSSVFWGQTGLHMTSDNLTITYNCFLVVNNSGWAAALSALAGAAQSAGGVAGPYGWAFGVGSVAAAAAAAAVNAASGDDLKLNGQQTISKSELLDLTNGRVWNVRESGGDIFSKWDWELQIESWGCAAGSAPPK
jgi:hypothetical protein